MSEENKPTPEAIEQVVADVSGQHIVSFQHVIITLADGRRGVFYGPELIKEVEMKLNAVPRLVSVDFDPPRAVSVPVPRPVEETPNADTKVDDKPAAGLE